MPSIRKRKDGSLQLRVRLKGYNPYTETFPKGTSRDDIWQKELQVECDLRLGKVETLQRKVLGVWTLRGLIEKYIQELEVAVLESHWRGHPVFALGKYLKKTWKYDADFLKSFLKYKPALSNRFMDQVSDTDCEDYRDRCPNGVGPYGAVGAGYPSGLRADHPCLDWSLAVSHRRGTSRIL